jgi:hypothetical protein
VAAILVGVLKCRAQIWKRTTQESFQQSLVEIDSVVSEEKIFLKLHPPFFLICIIGQNRQKFKVYYKNVQHVKIYLPCNFEVNPITHFDRLCKLEKRGDEIKTKSSPLKLLSQSQPNYAEMILRWSPFKIVSVSAVLYPRWPPLLKIEKLKKKKMMKKGQ